jgi:hypothetical protein
MNNWPGESRKQESYVSLDKIFSSKENVTDAQINLATEKLNNGYNDAINAGLSKRGFILDNPGYAVAALGRGDTHLKVRFNPDSIHDYDCIPLREVTTIENNLSKMGLQRKMYQRLIDTFGENALSQMVDGLGLSKTLQTLSKVAPLTHNRRELCAQDEQLLRIIDQHSEIGNLSNRILADSDYSTERKSQGHYRAVLEMTFEDAVNGRLDEMRVAVVGPGTKYNLVTILADFGADVSVIEDFSYESRWETLSQTDATEKLGEKIALYDCSDIKDVIGTFDLCIMVASVSEAMGTMIQLPKVGGKIAMVCIGTPHINNSCGDPSRFINFALQYGMYFSTKYFHEHLNNGPFETSYYSLGGHTASVLVRDAQIFF